MQHFWTGDDHPAARQAQIEDWIEDFEDLGPDLLAYAAKEWRQIERKRPTIADLRKIAIREQQDRQLDERRRRFQALPKPPEKLPRSQSDIEEDRRLHAQELGFESWEALCDYGIAKAILERKDPKYRVPIGESERFERSALESSKMVRASLAGFTLPPEDDPEVRRWMDAIERGKEEIG